MHSHPKSEWRRYVAVFGVCSMLPIAAVLALNYHVDPYLTHQWNTAKVDQLRPAREKLGAWAKTYALTRYQPDILYIGNSRTELGLPTKAPLLAGKQVFNAGLSGASLGDAIAMITHAAHVSRPATVVWGIDAPSFSMEVGNTDFDRGLVAEEGGHTYAWRRPLLNLKRALTVDMTEDSIRMLRGTYGQTCHSSLVQYGQRDEVCVHDRIDGWGGTQAAILPRTTEFVRGAGPTAGAMAGLDGSVAKLCRSGTRLRLYINPTHAMMLEALYQAGKWPAVERWQTALTDLAARQRALGCDVRLYDFSGFNSITSEAIPLASGKPDMLNYWETSHYRVNVGRMILERLLGAAPAAADGFGIELTPAGMSAHLAALRAGLARYRVEHPTEATLARGAAAAYAAPARPR